MELRVIGCHGGETPKHRTTAFVLDDRLTLDAGSLTQGLELEQQYALEACVISHSHLDHIRDLATVADNRIQAGCEPLVVAANAATLAALKAHFFNDLIWPDFSKLPTPKAPTIRYVELKPEKPRRIAGYSVTAIDVNHTVDTSGFIVKKGGTALGFSGDTGPTDRLWELLNAEPSLKALLMEVSFPNAQRKLAQQSGHHTPRTMAKDLRKLRHPEEIPALLYHLKPAFQSEIERECGRLKGLNLAITSIDDHYVL